MEETETPFWHSTSFGSEVIECLIFLYAEIYPRKERTDNLLRWMRVDMAVSQSDYRLLWSTISPELTLNQFKFVECR